MAAATNSALASSSSAKGRLLFYGAAPSSSVLLPISSSLPSSPTRLRSSTRPPCDQQLLPKDWELRHRTLLVDSFHRNNGLRALLLEVSDSKGSGPLRVLTRDGDWPDDHFWAVVALLVETGRADEALKKQSSKCVKRMESSGCFPDEVTYNTLITEFARSGLTEKMEGVCRVLGSKHMKLQISTLVAMLEAYADLGMLAKMEKVYRRVLRSDGFIKENLIRKLATVYIKNYRFAQLEELGNDISAKSGRTDLVWHIMLLSSACLLSKKGVESLVQEMKLAKVTVNITITNILAHFYLNMKDFKSLDIVFLQAKANKVKPDVMTIGVFFDACKIGYDGTWTLERWIKNGSLEEVVGLKADQLVVTAFGKGFFLKLCEKHYSSLHPKEKEKKLWRYSDMIKLVFGKKSKGKD
ncbi:hypothetical protein GW17_00004392 [Ensete ventricosum]|nr:hypothetical protein GW17_00004392 [Ensete ventricosum]